METFPFRPWVRRAGLSILLVATISMAFVGSMMAGSRHARYGWAGEPVVWIYLGVLWLGGARVFFGTFGDVARVDDDALLVRPLHQFAAKRVTWDRIRGTEQVVPGDRLIVYYDTPNGMRFIALNLNLVKGRRAFEQTIEKRLRALGFVEKGEGPIRALGRVKKKSEE